MRRSQSVSDDCVLVGTSRASLQTGSEGKVGGMSLRIHSAAMSINKIHLPRDVARVVDVLPPYPRCDGVVCRADRRLAEIGL